MISNNHSLKALNTFGMSVRAKYYARIESPEDLSSLMDQAIYKENPHFLLGGGSNVLFTGDVDGLIIHMATKGMEVTGQEPGKIYLKVQAGEVWDDLVAHCVSKGWGGLENLSLIPGQVGSSPIQNIGAYGVELKDYFHQLTALHKSSKTITTFNKESCRFGYRDSIFKREARDEYIILSVTFCLHTHPKIKTDYGSIARELENMKIDNPGIADVRKAVCRIRESKLPDPDIVGNAGSFFKNPVIPVTEFENIRKQFPDIVFYPDKGGIKLAAGWLIEKAGWKGFRRGDAGVHEKQALVLINYGNANGNDILNLSREISSAVKKKFGVLLEPEVNIV